MERGRSNLPFFLCVRNLCETAGKTARVAFAEKIPDLYQGIASAIPQAVQNRTPLKGRVWNSDNRGLAVHSPPLRLAEEPNSRISWNHRTRNYYHDDHNR